MSHFLINLVSTGGLVAILLTMTAESAGIPISSEIVVPLGGYLAFKGNLSLWGVVAAASAGNLIGSVVAFEVTKRYGRPLILGPGRRLGLNEEHLDLADRFFHRFGLFAVFAGRLLPVVRTYISFPAGLSRIRRAPFVVATLAGAIPWNLGLAYAGWKLGENYDRVSGAVGRFTIPFAALILLVIAVVYALGRRRGDAT